MPALAAIFKLVPLDNHLYFVCAGCAVGFVIIAEIVKIILAKIFHKK